MWIAIQVFSLYEFEGTKTFINWDSPALICDKDDELPKVSWIHVALSIYLKQFIHVKSKYTIPNTAYCNIISFEINPYLTRVVSHLYSVLGRPCQVVIEKWWSVLPRETRLPGCDINGISVCVERSCNYTLHGCCVEIYIWCM